MSTPGDHPVAPDPEPADNPRRGRHAVPTETVQLPLAVADPETTRIPADGGSTGSGMRAGQEDPAADPATELIRLPTDDDLASADQRTELIRLPTGADQGGHERPTEQLHLPPPPATRAMPVDHQVPAAEPVRPVPNRAVRGLRALAGLLSAGMVLLGLGLLVLRFVVPALRDGTGIDESTGPGIAEIAAVLGAGVGGEFARIRSRRATVGAQAWLAVAVVLVSLAALWFAWWG